MLMLLDASLATHGGPNAPAIGKALDTLALGFREGKHIIAAAPATIDALLRIEGLQSNTRSALLTIKERFPQLMALPGQLSSYALITSDQSPIERKLIAGKDVVQIPISFFTDSSKVQTTILLTEHLDDGSIAKEMGRYYRSSIKLNMLPIRCEIRCGAGSNMSAVLGSIQDAKERFCVVLVDSDKSAPNGALGDTARSITRFINQTKWPLTSLLVLDCKEMENAIPDAAWSEALANDSAHCYSIEFLTRLSSECPDSRNFIDIKRGFCRNDVFEASENSPERIFWESKIPMLNRLSIPAEHNASCQKFGACASPENCKCRFLFPNASRLLDLANKTIEKWGTAEWRNLGERCQKIWQSVGKLVFEWSCGWEFSSV